MRVVILVNPKAGVGRGLPFAESLARSLRARSLSVNVLPIGEQATRLLNAGALEPAAALVVAGGDGTLCRAAQLAIDADRPVWHCPLGNENLFAREFGMTTDATRIAHAVKQGRTRRIDLGVANGHVFTIMASVGIDAAIVHRMARVRARPIGHRSYVLPSLAETLTHRPPRLTIRVDGEPFIRDTPGLAVIANSARYGVDLDPAPDARVDDGLLDVAFLPAASIWSLARWFVECRLRRHTRRPGYRAARGKHIQIEADGPWAPVQLDGEAPGVERGSAPADTPVPARTPITASVRPGALPVLLPAEGDPE